VRGLTGYRDDLAERDNATRRSRIADGVFSAAVCDVAMRSQLALMCMPLNHAVQADARGHFVLPVPAMPMAWRLTGSTGRFSYSAGAGLPMVHTGSGSVSGVKLEFR
jgi:hypothetical protein